MYGKLQRFKLTKGETEKFNTKMVSRIKEVISSVKCWHNTDSISNRCDVTNVLIRSKNFLFVIDKLVMISGEET